MNVSVAYLVLEISIKMYFLSYCNFCEFVTFFTKKKERKLVKWRQVIFRDGDQEKMWFECNFLWIEPPKKCNRITSFLSPHCEKWLAAVWRVFFFFFLVKKGTNSRKLQFEGKNTFIDISGTRSATNTYNTSSATNTYNTSF